MYVLTVDFFVKPEHLGDFMPEMLSNAVRSLQTEPGCSQFDVSVSPADPNHIFLYEIYDDEPAFQQHLVSAHFTQFNEVTADWISDKKVEVFNRLTPVSANQG